MSANLGAHSVRGGYNQSGGAYFIAAANLENVRGTAPAYINVLSAAGSNSGGAWAPPSLSLTGMSTVLGVGALTGDAPYGYYSSIVQRGALLKDMGRTVVSSGRTFRKFAPVVSGTATASSLGVFGHTTAAPNAGYGSFYLEVGREGAGSAAPAPIARYF